MAKAARRTRDDKPASAADDGADAGRLASAAAAVARDGAENTHGLRGLIERADWGGVEGWAWDPTRPSAHVVLELTVDGRQIAASVADLPRADLAEAGIGDGRHGFRIELTPGLLQRGRHELHLRCADSGEDLHGSPVALEPEMDERRNAFRYYLDEVTDAGIVGWISARAEPTRRCNVLLKEGGRVLARATASQFRADLQSAGIGDGSHAFSLPMPHALLDGAEHLLDIVEEESGVALNDAPLHWRSGAGTAGAALTGVGGAAEAPAPAAPQRRSAPRGGGRAPAQTGTRLLFDISDLVYYIGHHPNLTGIQRVQSSIVLAMMREGLVQPSLVSFLSYNARQRRWTVVPTGFLLSLLQDLFRPEAHRMVTFSAEEARVGQLPGAREFDGVGVLDDGNPSVLCLLGAAWVQRDYFQRVLTFKRRFGTRFVMMVHDLIPIYARETCDQGTARVFEEFMRRAMRHVDHYLSVSENTARDLRRYMESLSLPEPAVTVSRNGSSFDEFLSAEEAATAEDVEDIPDRFVLFVATIEGRKNHQLMLDIWRRMLAEGDDPPHLICVGRVGWKSERFVAEMVESNYLDGRIVLQQEVSDAHLKLLYDRCMFTVCPSLYEGWGLPVGESLAAGKICVLSDRASLPEVAGEFGVYIDIDNREQCWRVVRGLVLDDDARMRLETKIRDTYRPTTWGEVAGTIVSACTQAAQAAWREPYPNATIPYGAEVSFAWHGREADAVFGDGLLNRIVDTRRGHFLPDPLQEASFLRGEEARGSGIWAEPEPWGCWLCHGSGDLVLGLPPGDSAVAYVFLRLRASGPVADAPLRLSCNGEVVWQGRIGERPRDVVARVRRRGRTGGGEGWLLKLRAEMDLSPELRAQVLAVDGRAPTVGFERLIVVPESDLKTRLDVLTNLLSGSV